MLRPFSSFLTRTTPHPQFRSFSTALTLPSSSSPKPFSSRGRRRGAPPRFTNDAELVDQVATTSCTTTSSSSSSSSSSADSSSSYQPVGFRAPLHPGSGSRPAMEEFWKYGDFDPTCSSQERRDHHVTGDPWPACLLRLKSFEDLHKLWYVCLKEKNFLLSERQAYRQTSGTRFRGAGRLKKVKLTMKRILTVLSRREIHQQALRAKEILALQGEREIHETRRFHLLEQNKMLQAKLDRLENESPDAISRQAWLATLDKNEQELQTTLQTKLKPLRRATMALLTPDWRYSKKYTDLPGCKRWKKEWVRAMDEHAKRRPVRYY